MQTLMPSSHHAIKAYSPNSAISNWFYGAKTNRYILIFKLTTGIFKLSANLLMMFIPGTSFMSAVQTRNWNTSYSSQLNSFTLITLGKPLKALSNINNIDNFLHHKIRSHHCIWNSCTQNLDVSRNSYFEWSVYKLVVSVTLFNLSWS